MVNVKDLDDIWQLVKREAVILTGNATGEKFAAAVKSLGEKIQLQLIKENKRLHYVIFNMEQPYKKSFEGFMDYQEHYIYDTLFGVWIFECGIFENCGIGSYENWTFGSYEDGHITRSGEPVQLFRKAYWPFDRHCGDPRIVNFSKI